MATGKFFAALTFEFTLDKPSHLSALPEAEKPLFYAV
jgi:hypothetical protein